MKIIDFSNGKEPAINGNNLNELQERLIELIHPIGSIYMTVNNENPSTLFGGTWVAWGSGKVPVGVDTTQEEFKEVEQVGGEKEHTLTIGEMPTHEHVLTIGYGGVANGEEGNAYKPNNSPSYSGEVYGDGYGANISENGGGQAHNNLQPYITCYMWKRTA